MSVPMMVLVAFLIVLPVASAVLIRQAVHRQPTELGWSCPRRRRFVLGWSGWGLFLVAYAVMCGHISWNAGLSSFGLGFLGIMSVILFMLSLPDIQSGPM